MKKVKARKIEEQKFIELKNKGLNNTEIANIIGCCVSSVSLYSKRRKIGSNFKYKRNFDEDKFIELHSQGLNDCEIAKKLGISKSSSQDYRSSKNLEVNYLKYDDTTLTYEEEQILIGGLLGDSHMRKEYRNASIEMTHSTKQKEYFLWKLNKMSRFCKKYMETSQIHKKTRKEYFKITTRSVCHPVFNPYYDLFYKNKKKIVSKELIEKLDGLGLAIWYMDDGSKSKNGYTIATMSFSKEEVDVLCNYLKNKYNIETTSPKSNIIYIKKKSVPTFKMLVEPYITNSMKYKI